MYFEERMINGIMHYRTDPDGRFIPYTLDDLSMRYKERKEEVNKLRFEIKHTKEETAYRCAEIAFHHADGIDSSRAIRKEFGIES